MNDKRILTTGEIANYCGVNFRTVIRWIQRGQLRAYQLPGRGDNRVEVHNFILFLRENNIPIPRDFLHLARRVLVVEDDPVVAQTIERVLVKHNFDVFNAQDGFSAGSLLREHLPCVMTLDLRMPGLGGFDVIEYVRLAPDLSRTKILVVSALEDIELDRARLLGADDILQKPFELEELARRVVRLAGVELRA
jgi:excisionase family DNA binding protein